MTATIAGHRPGQQEERDGFARILHAEWTKFRTVRGWVIAVVVAAALMDLVGLFAADRTTSAARTVRARPRRAACIPPVPTGRGGEAVTDSFYFVRPPYRYTAASPPGSRHYRPVRGRCRACWPPGLRGGGQSGVQPG